ncbi:MAG: ATP-binding protein [Marinomonas sp.]
MVVLLNDILDIAKIEAGKMTVVPEPTNVRDLVTSSTSMMKAAARQKGLRLTVVVDERIPRELMLDGLRVRQVLSNLIGNAIKFTDNGAVDVRIRPMPAKEGAAIETMELSIADTGIGIAPEWQSVVFDQFVQADGSSRRSHGGTGLGLPISRKLAQLMNGTLTLESREGEGTLVALRIPLVRIPSAKSGPKNANTAPAQPRFAPEPLERYSQRRGKVLVADDCDVNQMLMQDMLANLGFAVITASNGAEAVTLVEQAKASGQPVGLILMDMQMPDVDGLEATRRLRAQGFDAAQLPIIALTASAFQGDVEACLEIGMQQHLAKPIGQRDLIAAIDRWLVQAP